MYIRGREREHKREDQYKEARRYIGVWTKMATNVHRDQDMRVRMWKSNITITLINSLKRCVPLFWFFPSFETHITPFTRPAIFVRVSHSSVVRLSFLPRPRLLMRLIDLGRNEKTSDSDSLSEANTGTLSTANTSTTS